MFNVSGTEIVVILLVALVVLGPDKLPDAIRRVGRVYGELRRMSNGFQAEIRDAFDEPIREMRSTMDAARTGFLEPMDDDGSTTPAADVVAASDPEPAPAPEPVADLRAGDSPDDPLKMRWPPSPAPGAGTEATAEPTGPAEPGELADDVSADPAHRLEVGDEELRPFEGVLAPEDLAPPPASAAADEAEHPTS